jgi:hypothetical protein
MLSLCVPEITVFAMLAMLAMLAMQICLEEKRVLSASFLHAGISCDCSAVACIACLRAYFKMILAGTQIHVCALS